MFNRWIDLDARLSSRLRVAERPGGLRALAGFLAHSGDSWYWLLGLGVLWLLGTDFWKVRAANLALGIVVTGLIVFAIKLVVRRRRPAGDWGNVYRRADPHSFPSGHAARALMLAVVTVGMGPAWLAWVLIVWAPLVTAARVAMGLHYLSDVVAGALLGVIVGAGLLMLF
jgi:undecaprenyl-diphosphatase